jgi:steroid delta-isomerase-like uncharacterized protein
MRHHVLFPAKLALWVAALISVVGCNGKSSNAARENVNAYFQTHDTKYLTEDAEFTDLTTGQVTTGREAIGKMLHHIYHEAFDAHAEIVNTVVTENKAVLEATFTGKHIGEFAGVAATGKDVKVPLCVVYELSGDKIKRARIYLLGSVLFQQLSGN